MSEGHIKIRANKNTGEQEKEGAALEEPSGLFNSTIASNVRRAIDINEGGKVDESIKKEAAVRRPLP